MSCYSFTQQQAISFLNGVSPSSFLHLQPSLFSRGRNLAKEKIKVQKRESLSSCASITAAKNKEIKERTSIKKSTNHSPYKSLGKLPDKWWQPSNVPNTLWLPNKSSETVKNESYKSHATFYLNKNGMFISPQQYYQTPKSMLLKNKKSFTDLHIRGYSNHADRILQLERAANEQTYNANIQAEYLKVVLNEDPEYVIRRYESGMFASNESVKDIYMKALIATGRLTQSEAQRRFNKNTMNLGRIGIGNNTNSGPYNNNNSSPPGTEDQPVHVVMNSKKKSSWEPFWNVLRLVIGMGVAFYAFNMMSTRMLNVNQKEILPDQTDRNCKFDDVQGCDEAKQELQEVVEFLLSPEKFERLGAKLHAGVLLVGPPGTGKTLLARAIAGEANVPFFFVSGSEFDELFVGVGASRVRKLFAAAKEHAPCIIFIDELDAIGSKRIPNDLAHSRMTLNQLLVELDGFDQTEGVIVIGATNFPEILDKALTRPGRFDTQVFVQMPDVRGRIAILDLYLKKTPCGPDVDSTILARGTPGFSGADLSNLVNQAALRAAALNMDYVTMEHLEWAKEKIVMGPERKSAVIAEENRKLVAYHESGHAIVALFTPDAQPVHKATVIPRGSALGYVMQLPEKDELSWSKKQLLAKMDVCMGGRVAEEMIFGEDSITTGASSDMKQATKIARAMVTEYGMSEKVGTVLIDEQQEKLSPDLQCLVETEVKRLIQEAYVRAKAILYKRSKEHKRLAEALLKYETLDADEVKLVIKGYALPDK